MTYQQARHKPYPLDHKYLVYEDGTVVSRYSGKPLSILMHGDRKKNKAYPSVSLRLNGKAKIKKLSHMVLETFVGAKPPGHHGSHLDGNKMNNSLTNLKWCTPKENESHQKIHGTSAAAKNGRKSAIKHVQRGVGVHKQTCAKTWHASIGAKSKQIYLGTYPNKELALAARRGAMLLGRALGVWNE